MARPAILELGMEEKRAIEKFAGTLVAYFPLISNLHPKPRRDE